MKTRIVLTIALIAAVLNAVTSQVQIALTLLLLIQIMWFQNYKIASRIRKPRLFNDKGGQIGKSQWL